MKMRLQSDVLLAPEMVSETNGIACGDVMRIHAFRDDGKLYFAFTGKACDVSNRVAEYLVVEFSGQKENVILDEVEKLRRGEFTDKSEWISEYYASRKNCVESPVSLLSNILADGDNCHMGNSGSGYLACDACVNMRKINWGELRNESTGKKLIDVFRDVNVIDQDEIYLQSMATCVLNDSQQTVFRSLLSNVDADVLKRIKKLRLAAPLFNNAINYNLPLDNRIIGLAVKQRTSLAVSSREIYEINSFIESNGLRIDEVKGGKTSAYYPEKNFRAHMDYDYLAGNIEDAMIMVSFLINKKGFKLVVDGSVPFSIKSVIDYDGEEVLTGHIHLEKILQNIYQVVVDINMGGFPLGRTGIIKCNQQGKIEAEDLVCITIAHLFKHEHAYIKDINDLYYLLGSKDIRSDILSEKIEQYQLGFLFTFAYDYLRHELGLTREYKRYDTYVLKRIGKNWPYSKKSHFYIKVADLFRVNKKKFGIVNGISETKHQICGNEGVIKSRRFSEICAIVNERTYLYPILMFNRFVKIKKIVDAVMISDAMMVYKNIMILPIGLFYMQNLLSDVATRELMEKDVLEIMEQLEIVENDLNFDYFMQARKDTWLY